VTAAVPFLFKRSCFAAGTPIRTPEGSKAIEAIRPGDLVLARDESGPDCRVEAKLVEEVFATTARLLELTVGGRAIRTTAEHPLYVRGAGWLHFVRTSYDPVSIRDLPRVL
jgi:hypothetical protein